MQLKLDDNEEKVDHLKEKERKTVEKIKMKYKKENKRVTNDDDDQIEIRQTKRRKKQDDDIENGESDEKMIPGWWLNQLVLKQNLAVTLK